MEQSDREARFSAFKNAVDALGGEELIDAWSALMEEKVEPGFDWQKSAYMKAALVKGIGSGWLLSVEARRKEIAKALKASEESRPRSET